jgi:hypothetical protein
VVQEEVLATVTSESLAVYAVWEPILLTDDERWARKAATLFPDSRVRNFWIATDDLGEAFQPALSLTGEPAWDVYLLYGPRTEWHGPSPPAPEFFMHQLRGRLPDSLGLDGQELASAIQVILARKGL